MSGDGVQTGSSDGTEPGEAGEELGDAGKELGDTGEAASRASDDCSSSERDSGKTSVVGVGERGNSKRVVKGGDDGMLNLPTSWNSRCSQ